ncbi:MAG: aminomethyl-transferring glycine dehydrogenase subunit GcvPA [Gammaproteobacteria bacterium]|nr:aminomethyl-transferring glycine dehydrogenase subunit GcvPA [Gammaproteobacteria bacterium]
MPFIPHTEADIEQMLAQIGVSDIEQLFDEIPEALRSDLEGIGPGLNEADVTRLMSARAGQDAPTLSFLGAGAYQHHIPAAVWEITTRGEFYSAYTPYQAEASQGTLQLLYEYQSMMASLTGMDVANASLYDGATALAEAVLMAVRANRKDRSKRILLPRNLHPRYRQVVETIVSAQGIVLESLDFDLGSGTIDPSQLKVPADGFAALVIPQPNFFGALEAVDQLTDWARQHNGLTIAVVNPTALALLKPPGAWGEQGADITCGEGQPLGIPLSSGGPYFGFMACRKGLERQMPGRIVGRTRDLDGKEGFVLTLQAREQHIRRGKATSNICTNQGLMVTAATLYMSLVGPDGLREVAALSHQRTRELTQTLSELPGVEPLFTGPCFHEVVFQLPAPVQPVVDELLKQGIIAGYDLTQAYPELGNALLCCATELTQPDEIAQFAEALRQILPG